MLKSYKIYTCTNGTLGLHLSRAPWDPYPWVSSIQKESTSYQAGLRIGDCLLELNGQDVLGMKISEIAALLKNHWLNESSNYVTVVIWRNKCNNGSNKKHNNNVSSSEEATTNACNEGDCDDDDDEDEENNAHNINQQSLQKFATCLQHIAQLLECPVCLEVIKPPGWQCCNGHVLCNNCRSRSEKCPVCRVPLGPRGRCLLSDKLFTLLADSFPCDGVRSNKTSPKDRRKCSTEFHNQPKMAIIQKQQQQQQQLEKDELQQQGAKKAKDFLLTSLRNRRRKISTTKIIQNTDNSENLQRAGTIKKEENEDEQQHENKHLSIQKQVMYDTNTVVVVTSGMNNRKSSLDYTRVQQLGDLNDTEGVVATARSSVFCNELLGQTATIQQCHCITCRYKPDKFANVNNVTTTTVLRPQNKYILRITSQEQKEKKIVLHQQYKEKYQNYQCPTGKLCCLNVNMMPHDATCTTTTATIIKNINNENVKPFQINSMTNRNLSTENIATAQQINDFNFTKTLKNEWEILAHLTEDHKLPVQQYYALYGQRIYLHCLSQQNVITCLNLKGSNEPDSKIEKFFIVCMPLEMTSNINAIPTKVALYVYHMNTLTNNTATTTTSPITSTSLDDDDDGDAVVVDVDEVSNFETIIENPLTGIKWFGQAHPLTTPWSHIFEKQHFLEYNVATTHDTCATQITADNSSGSSDGASRGDNAFVIVVKRKLEMKTKI